jgi:hypothetical protein
MRRLPVAPLPALTATTWLAVRSLHLVSLQHTLTSNSDVGGTKGVSRVQSVRDGALLTFEIREWADDASKGSIDRGHKGPCAVYLKKVSSAVDDKAAGDGWFKLFDHGYDASTKRWCTDEIVDNKGLLSVNLPKGLEGGYYLARPEILALHAANAGDPQPYTGCAQIFLESNGNLGPESTVSIPGHMKAGEPSTSFDIYNTDNAKYTMPGPAVAKLVAKAGSASTSSSQSQGLKPEGCLVENANWCGKEVSSYSDESGCWAASEDCWAQSKTCWSSAPPTGGSGCKLWETKCTGIQDACSAKHFNGPPNKGTVMTAEKKAIDVGPVMATVGGGVVDAPTAKTSKTEAAAKETPAPVQDTPAKETPVAEPKDEDNKSEVPAQSPAKTSPAAAPQAPKPTPAAPKPTDDNSYPVQPAPQKEDKPSTKDASITASASAPKATKGPACVPGGKCVTVTEVEVVTQTVYVTAAYDAYKRDFIARRKHARHV